MKEVNKYKDLKVTYGELETVLKKLNYEKKRKDNVIIFVNNEFDSVILLTKKRKNALVFPPILSGETHIMYLKGVIKKEEDLPNLILKERALKKEKKTKAAA